MFLWIYEERVHTPDALNVPAQAKVKISFTSDRWCANDPGAAKRPASQLCLTSTLSGTRPGIGATAAAVSWWVFNSAIHDSGSPRSCAPSIK